MHFAALLCNLTVPYRLPKIPPTALLQITGNQCNSRSILTLLFHLLLDPPRFLFPLAFKTQYPIRISLLPPRYNKFSSTPSSCTLINILRIQITIQYSANYHFHLSPDISLNTLFSNTLNLYFSFNVRDSSTRT